MSLTFEKFKSNELSEGLNELVVGGGKYSTWEDNKGNTGCDIWFIEDCNTNDKDKDGRFMDTCCSTDSCPSS